MPKESSNGIGEEDIRSARRALLGELNRLTNPPNVNSHGVYISHVFGENGAVREQWATRKRAAGILTENGTQISGSGLKQRMDKKCPGHPTIEVQLERGGTAEAVPLSDAEESISDLAEIKIFLPKDGIHISEEGRYATTRAMIREFGVTKPAILDRLDGVNRLRARNWRGRPVLIHDMDELERRLKPLTEARRTSTVRVDKDGYYKDKTELWATIQAFYDSLPPEQKRKTCTAALRRHAEKHCRSLAALDREERPNAKVYPVLELKALPILSNEIRVGSDGIYTDEEGKQWATGSTWREAFRVSQKGFDRGIKKEFGNWDNIPHIRGFSLARREDDLYSKEAILQALSYIFEAEHLVVKDVLTVIEETSGKLREVAYVTTDEIKQIIPKDIVPEYTYGRKFSRAGTRIDGIDRTFGVETATFDLNEVIAAFRDKIVSALATIPEREGQLISISEYLNANPEANRKHLLANTDKVERVRRRTQEGNIVYLYKKQDLDQIAKAA